MVMLDPRLVETLLYTSESSVADYKRAQYPIDNDDQKGELVKDIVAFANAWKTSDAHILIGVEDGHGMRGTVHGLQQHLDDATVQQIVNSKLNQPVTFTYVPAVADGKQIAIIVIAREQNRPIFLKKKFGKLEPEKVFIRRGSATVIAAPDEIARMGAAQSAPALVPQLTLRVGDPSSHELLSPLIIHSKILSEPPDLLLDKLLVASAASLAMTRPDPKELRAYERTMALVQRLGFAVKNEGAVLLQDVRVHVKIPKASGLVLLDEKPTRPEPAYMPRFPKFKVRGRYGTDVEDVRSAWELEARVGKVQTGATVWSESFWIGSSVQQELDLVARVSSDELPKPIEVPLRLEFQVTDEGAWMDPNVDVFDEGDEP